MPSQAMVLLQLLTFLGAVAAMGLAAVAAVWCALTGRRSSARLAVGVAAVVGGSYGAALLVAGMVTEERVLGPGEEKYFCEIDCHLAYRVVGVHTTGRVGDAIARGTFYVVDVATRFDPNTTGAGRDPAARLFPNPRQAHVVDSTGRVFPLSADGQRALADAGRAGTPLDRPLLPGEEYRTRLVFDLPRGIAQPRLALQSDEPVERFLLGHERAPFHGATLFALGRGFVGAGR
jgi:hypothetical protein